MCVPKQNIETPAAAPVASQQSASSLQLGGMGASRGAAALGRLQLRFGGGTAARSTAVSPSTQTSSASTSAPTQSPSPAPASTVTPGVDTTGGGMGDTLRGAYRRVPNSDLRLPLA